MINKNINLDENQYKFKNQPTPSWVKAARITLSILVVTFFAVVYMWGLKIQTDSISSNYEAKIKNLETQILANSKLAENKQIQLIDRIEILSIENKSISESSKKTAYLEIEEFLKSKLDIKVAEIQQKK